ncbi:MAG TPA: hypothetical protein VGJ00_08850 [Rhabdochlamydiaceae bacterium]|jgi:hypothetical protein
MTLKDAIEFFGRLIISNVAVTMSLILVIAKFCMVRLAGDKDTQRRNFLRIPEELAYIALSFVLAGLSGDMKAFRKYFADSTQPAVNVAMLFVAACSICMWIHFAESRWVTPYYERWRAADEVLEKHEQNAKKKSAVQIENYRRIWTHNFAAISIFYLFFCFAPAAYWLWYVAEIVAHNQ